MFYKFYFTILSFCNHPMLDGWNAYTLNKEKSNQVTLIER